MAAAFKLQPQLAGGEAAAGLGMEKGAAKPQTKRAQPAQGRAKSELRNSPARPSGGQAPENNQQN